MNDQEVQIATKIWPQHMLAFQRQWEDDPYAIQRTRALSWLGDRYLCARPINASRQKTTSV